MRKVIAISAFVIISAIVLTVEWYSVHAGEDRGRQLIDNYVDKANHGAEKVKFHLALELSPAIGTTISGRSFSGHSTTVLPCPRPRSQLHFLEKMRSPSFTTSARSTFQICAPFTIRPIGKSALVHDWTPERKHRLWQMNVALGLVRYDLKSRGAAVSDRVCPGNSDDHA
jgi:hypothetical protein